jgi:hypothetical protein
MRHHELRSQADELSRLAIKPIQSHRSTCMNQLSKSSYRSARCRIPLPLPLTNWATHLRLFPIRPGPLFPWHLSALILLLIGLFSNSPVGTGRSSLLVFGHFGISSQFASQIQWKRSGRNVSEASLIFSVSGSNLVRESATFVLLPSWTLLVSNRFAFRTRLWLLPVQVS